MLKWLAEEEFARRMPRGRLSTPPSDEGAQLDADLALKQRVAELGKTQTNTPLEYNPFVKGARR